MKSRSWCALVALALAAAPALVLATDAVEIVGPKAGGGMGLAGLDAYSHLQCGLWDATSGNALAVQAPGRVAAASAPSFGLSNEDKAALDLLHADLAGLHTDITSASARVQAGPVIPPSALLSWCSVADATSGTTQCQAAPASGSLHVIEAYLASDGAGTAQLVAGTGTNCATSTVPVTPAFPTAAAGPAFVVRAWTLPIATPGTTQAICCKFAAATGGCMVLVGAW